MESNWVSGRYNSGRRACRATSEAAFKAKIESLFSKVEKLPLAFERTDTSTREEFAPKLVEFLEWTAFRPGDEDFAEDQTWKRFCLRVESYLEDKTPDMTLWWRIPVESATQDAYFILSYDDNGPDMDSPNDRRCHADKNWKRYAVYARFAVV